MMEILTTIVGFMEALKIKRYVIDPLKDQFSYLCCSNSIFKSFETEVQKLHDTRANLQLDVDDARRNLEIIGHDVEHWLERVNEIKKETDRILGAIPEVQQGCAIGSCPNLKIRYSVSRDAKKLTKDVVEIRGDGKFNRVGHPGPPPVVEITTIATGTEFKSRNTKEEEIMAALRDDSAYMIGICGMGGVGKTTMAKRIWKRATEEEKLFDTVVMPVVSQQPNHSGIQQHIAEALGLELKEQTIPIRASRIHTRLMDLKKILIIMDDIWENLDLEELGIPSQSNNKGCKIILTSRDRRVCMEMKATKVFTLESLLEKEAWTLFKDNAGTCVDHLDLHDIAEEVAKECKGLPLALVTVGRALRDKDTPIWRNALVQLQRPTPANIQDVLKEVYPKLLLSYEYLENHEDRYLFLLCCLFPEDSRISLEDLLYYGVGLGIFSNLRTLGEARDRIYTVVRRLESRYMLIDGGKYGAIKYVKMHDVIRDTAITIASSGEHVFMINHDTGLKDWPRKDSHENCTCISLKLNGDVTLPECINCPRLEMLRIKFHEDGERDCPDKCFDKMRKLNVLDAENITSLPSSLQFLTNLRTLRLQKSKMKTVSMIGKLVKLEILDLSGSNLEVLPKKIGELENLKCLDLSRCSKLREIAAGVISRLTRLEELFVLRSFKNWEAEVEGKERGNASLVEVASLKNLIALQLEIPDPKVLPQDTLHWSMLERFAILIGTTRWVYLTKYDNKSLIVDLNETTPLVHALIRKAHLLNLKLGGICANDEVISSIQGGNQDLKWLSLEGCGNIKYLANISNALKYLKLRHLCKLTHLLDQKLCLPYLTEVYIQNCSSLQYICLQSMAENLSRLKTLEIKECPVLEEVFKAERGENADVVNPIVFPNLTKLGLKELPNLNSFCKAVNGIYFPLLKDLHIQGLHNLKVFWPMEESSFFGQGEHNSVDGQFLFHPKVTFASIRQLRLYSIDTATKIFSSQIPVDSFSQLESLMVSRCPNLKVIFSPPAFRNFRNLERLSILDCSNLEAVIGKEDERAQAAANGPLFPKLETLKLIKLPNFKKFCRMKNETELPKLESITIEDCQQIETFSPRSLSLPSKENVFGLSNPNLATQIFFNKQVTFASLVELKLNNIGPAIIIFSSEIPKGSFSLLERLEVESCPNLEVIFPPAFRNLRTLRYLTVKSCPKLKEVVRKEDEESQAVDKESLFPELKKLVLSGLPNFKTFCNMMNDRDLPQLQNITIVDCPQLEIFSLGSLSLLSLTQVSGPLDPDLATQIFFKKKVTFASLVELKLNNIGPATIIFSSEISNGSFSQLEQLEVESCPNLEVIFPPAFRNWRRLRYLAVKNCPKLKEVVRKEDEESQAVDKESLFPKLEKLVLSGLPNFKTFCHMMNDIDLPQLQDITIVDCPQLETFTLGSLSLLSLTQVSRSSDPDLATEISFKKKELKTLTLKGLPNFKKFCHMKNDIEWQKLESVTLDDCPQVEYAFGLLDPNVATQFFHNKEVTFASLVELRLCNLSTATKIFSSQIPIDSFSQLELLEVESCPNLKVIFSPPAFRNFRTLHKLRVKNCSKLEEVVGKEGEESQAAVKIPLFPELKILLLSELPNFKTFCHMKNEIELPQLESITIEDCHEMEAFSMGSLSLPCLTYVFGLIEPNLATRIFFNKETPRHEIHLDNNSFMMSAKDLSSFRSYNSELCLAKGSSDDFIVVARQLGYRRLSISGRFEMVKLSPGTLYEVVFEIKLEESHFQFKGPVILKLTQLASITQERQEDLNRQPRGEWIEIFVGELTMGPNPIGDLELSLYSDFRISGLLIKGITIRPKA